MSRFENDMHGFSRAVSGARTFLSFFATDGIARQLKLEEARVMTGPFLDAAGKGCLSRLLNRAMNIIMWRQHAYNRDLLRSAQDVWIELEERRIAAAGARPTLAILVPYDVSENVTGGSSRLWGMAEALGRRYHVELLTTTRQWKSPQRKKIYPGVDLLSFPLSGPVEARINQNTPRFGNAAPFLTMCDAEIPFPLLDSYLRRQGRTWAGVVMDSPYLFDRLRRVVPEVPLIYETPNVNRDYLGRMAGDRRDEALPVLEAVERRAIADARMILCVSEEDRRVLSTLYPGHDEKFTVVPNGVSVAHCFRSFPSESAALARDHGFARPVVLFMGSVLNANIQAMTYILERLAPAVSGAQFVIMGVSRAEYEERAGPHALPDNVLFAGRVPEAEKEAILALTQLSIAPLAEGTGSSLKIPDYVAHGKPLISTRVGLRGFDRLSAYVEVADQEAFIPQLARCLSLLAENPAALDGKAETAWRVVQQTLDWPVLVDQMNTRMHSLLRT